MEKIENIILIALFINWLMMLPVYQNLTGLITNKFFKKLFTCEYCLTFHMSLALAIGLQDLNYVIVAVTAPVITTAVRRAVNALPITL
jgi:hypothetical protein